MKRYTNQTICATDGSGDTDVYLASEADAEIAKRDAAIKELSETLVLYAKEFDYENAKYSLARVKEILE